VALSPREPRSIITASAASGDRRIRSGIAALASKTIFTLAGLPGAR